MSKKDIRTVVKAHFDKDTANHVMEVIRDEGVNRHIRFRKPGTMCKHFDLITWDGCLCYTGDMGTFVFRRLEDMFQFFRTDGGRINLGYWSEKLIAMECSGRHSWNSVEEFDSNKFTAIVNEIRLGWVREAKRNGELTKDQRRELWEAVENDVLYRVDDGPELAYADANKFNWRADDHKINPVARQYQFIDFWEHDCTEYTHHFVWCCYAIAWAIGVYDKSKEAVPA